MNNVFKLADSLEALVDQAQPNLDRLVDTSQKRVSELVDKNKKMVTDILDQKKQLESNIELKRDRIAEYEAKLQHINIPTRPSPSSQEQRQRHQSLAKQNDYLKSDRDKLKQAIQRKKDEQQSKQEQDTTLLSRTKAELQACIEVTKMEMINKPGGNEVKIVMKAINPHDPEQVFSLTHYLDEHMDYKIIQIDPPLPQSFLFPLLEDLNMSRDFYGFLKKIRSAFKDMVKE
ncbi:uncharacterized protein B0P05DRAFT_560943 [Gilbertella persicaria]|uniref:uncharacterized protein n=1 Tax=Gilbertella persicaria TaxID=101096 RepID=UPI0022208102|nr:uncharacterized protein B0P05DRAFT_560943 [Gilbertella persicaria]KAI8054971.1 hypothetical protein B0P05DRAFT_560943 [Gilbertella persicaria]